MQLVSLMLIHWTEIYPMDSAIQLLNNWGLKEQYYSVISPLALPSSLFRGGAESGWGSNHNTMVDGKIQDSHQEVKITSFRSEIHDLLGTVKPVLG